MAQAGIVYVGTSDGLATYSDPGGTGRWRRVGHDLAGRRVRALLAADALTVLAVVDQGALRTSDGGQSWELAPDSEASGLLSLAAASGPVVATAHGPAQWRGDHPPAPGATALALLAGKQETLIAAVAGGASLAYSVDGGASWQTAALETPLEGAVRALAPASYHMDIAWAGTDQGQILRSDNRGAVWREIAREKAAVLSLAVVRLA
jgi:photosystem II stability/assembly factor-like uncharacterized protein